MSNWNPHAVPSWCDPWTVTLPGCCSIPVINLDCLRQQNSVNNGYPAPSSELNERVAFGSCSIRKEEPFCKWHDRQEIATLPNRPGGERNDQVGDKSEIWRSTTLRFNNDCSNQSRWPPLDGLRKSPSFPSREYSKKNLLSFISLLFVRSLQVSLILALFFGGKERKNQSKQ